MWVAEPDVGLGRFKPEILELLEGSTFIPPYFIALVIYQNPASGILLKSSCMDKQGAEGIGISYGSMENRN